MIKTDTEKLAGEVIPLLHEMFGEQDARVLALVPDYKINLVAPASIKDSDFENSIHP